MLVAGGIVGGGRVNCSLALLLGLLGYGVSLVLFILSLRGLGAARTGAYFASAPFIGAAFSFVVLSEALTHEHSHPALRHRHPHYPDLHHHHTH
jgi:drug/metabolite transporter (DMT)-like permease